MFSLSVTQFYFTDAPKFTSVSVTLIIFLINATEELNPLRDLLEICILCSYAWIELINLLCFHGKL